MTEQYHLEQLKFKFKLTDDQIKYIKEKFPDTESFEVMSQIPDWYGDMQDIPHVVPIEQFGYKLYDYVVSFDGSLHVKEAINNPFIYICKVAQGGHQMIPVETSFQTYNQISYDNSSK